MNSRERVSAALDHSEPDRVPFDLGSCGPTAIQVQAYKSLLAHLGIEEEIELCGAVHTQSVLSYELTGFVGLPDSRSLEPLTLKEVMPATPLGTCSTPSRTHSKSLEENDEVLSRLLRFARARRARYRVRAGTGGDHASTDRSTGRHRCPCSHNSPCSDQGA